MENQENKNEQNLEHTIEEILEQKSENNENKKKTKKPWMTNDGKKFLIGAIIIVLILVIAEVILGQQNKRENQVNDNCATITDNQVNNGNISITELLPDPKKPIIYLYPTEETEVTVQLGKIDNLTCTYPKYPNSGWRVIAQPNGDLIDLDTNKKLYSLYYEAENTYPFEVTEEGFCIKGEDTACFLEEKLELLGLNYKEKEEFIVYWLPKLEQNAYNYIRFATAEEIESSMPLEVTPTPDSIIRILMVFKGLEEPIEVKEQELATPSRTGFTAVEWGGTEIE